MQFRADAAIVSAQTAAEVRMRGPPPQPSSQAGTTGLPGEHGSVQRLPLRLSWKCAGSSGQPDQAGQPQRGAPLLSCSPRTDLRRHVRLRIATCMGGTSFLRRGKLQSLLRVTSGTCICMTGRLHYAQRHTHNQMSQMMPRRKAQPGEVAVLVRAVFQGAQAACRRVTEVSVESILPARCVRLPIAVSAGAYFMLVSHSQAPGRHRCDARTGRATWYSYPCTQW